MINTEYKDRLFTKIFGREEHKDWALNLYNAVNGTAYTDAEAIEFNTLEDVLYMGMRNDVSFLFHMEMNIYEHQSTLNPNMPVRMLSYVGMLYRKYVSKSGKLIYGKKLVRVPLPKLVVFYNGVSDAPDETILKLSDALPEGSDVTKADVTARVRMLNINSDCNRELLESCQQLYEYTWFVDRTRTYGREMDMDAAVDRALEEMPEAYTIRNYLIGNRAEVKMDFLTEYDEAKVLEYIREEALEEGRKEGREEGRIRELTALVSEGILTISQAASRLGESEQVFLRRLGQ